MRRLLLSFLSIAPLVAAGCVSAKAPVTEDFSDLASLDQKSDAFSYRMKLLGSLDYGQTSDVVPYKNPPRFRGYKFSGHAGDQVDAWVRSTSGGDAIAWVLDSGYNVLATNDDAPEGGVDAHVSVKLTANADVAVTTYYVVFRDYDLHTTTFSVELQAKAATDFFSCNTDDDCVKVPQHVCCPDCTFAAVNKDQQDAYSSQPLTCPQIACPRACRLDQRVAQCNPGTKQCEMVEIADIACGGFVANAHQCPAGYECSHTSPTFINPDLPGKCVAQPQHCGGLANLPCPSGQTCVDDPSNNCDPAKGGADCLGICQ
jgi:hypothetical protein